MRRRLLFGKFDHIEFHLGGQTVTEMDINVGDVNRDLEVFGVYKSGRRVKVRNSNCLWESDGDGVTVGADSGIIAGIAGSDTPVNVTATCKAGGKTLTATVAVRVHDYACKYFVNADGDTTIKCQETDAFYGYTLYKTFYDNGRFIKAESTWDIIPLTFVLSGDADATIVTIEKGLSVSVENNKHSLDEKHYVGTFVMGGPDYEVEEVNFGDFEHSNIMTVTHLADSTDSSHDTFVYKDITVSVDRDTLSFPNTGGVEPVTATTSQIYTRTTYWTSDDTVKDTLQDTIIDDADLAWGGDIFPFSLDSSTEKTVNISVGATSSDENIERTLSVRAVSRKDDSKTSVISVTLIQASRSVVDYGEITIKDMTVVNPVVEAKGGSTSFSATYQQIQIWSDGSTTIDEIPSANVAYTQHSFDSLGTTPTTGETVFADGIEVLVTGLGTNPSTATFTYDAKQAENKLIKTEYLDPVITYSGENPIIIPASGGSASADVSSVTITQKKRETYSSEASIEKDADVSGASKQTTMLNAVSLGTVTTPQKKIGDSVITVMSNGRIATETVTVEQEANIPHDGSRGTTVSYSDWAIYFTNDTTTSMQDEYLDEKFGDDQYVEPDNANEAYNNERIKSTTLKATGGEKEIPIRAVRTKSTAYYYTSGEKCHVVKEPDYYGDTVKSGLSVSCTNGVVMGELSEPDAQYVITTTFPNPGSNESRRIKQWTVSASIEGQTVTYSISQMVGSINWISRTVKTTYEDAEPTEGAMSSPSPIRTTAYWCWNADTDNRHEVDGVLSYVFEGEVEEGITIDRGSGVITWSLNEGDSREVVVKVILSVETGIVGEKPYHFEGTAIAKQKSGNEIDHYTIENYSVSADSESQTVGAAGGNIVINRSGIVRYTETYANGTTSDEKTKVIPSEMVSVVESGDVYKTFSAISWDGADGSLTVVSHKTATRNEQTVLYTPSVSVEGVLSLFDGTVDSIGDEIINALSIVQSKNEKMGSVYGEVVLNPTSRDISFGMNGGTIDTEVEASQTYYDYYSSFEDGDEAEGRTEDLAVASFVFSEPVESGSYLTSFTASHHQAGEKHYVRVTADVNTLTSSKTGYSATMTVAGEGDKESSIVINATQDAGIASLKYFIVAGEDKNLPVNGTTASFTYKLYKTTYVSGVYVSCEESKGIVTGVYGGDISGTNTSGNGSMPKTVESNIHNTTAKTYTVEYTLPSSVVKETENFDGKVADYLQTITHQPDYLDDGKTVIEYTDYNAWIGDESTSESNVASIEFSKAGETKTLYGFSTEKKTTYRYWASDSTEDVTSREEEILKDRSVWNWSQPSSSEWVLTDTLMQNASAKISPSNVANERTVEVSLKATSQNKSTNTVTVKSTLTQSAGLYARYYIRANENESIGVTDTVATFGYTVIKNSYNGADGYINSAIYTGSGVDVNVVFTGGTSGNASITGTNRTVNKTVDSNKYKTVKKNYIATFSFADSTIEDTKRTAVVIDGTLYTMDKTQTISHNADSQTGGDDYVYSNPVITVSDVAFDRNGGIKDVEASSSVTKTTYNTWASDGTHSSVKSTETVGTTASEWDWEWSILIGHPFSIVGDYSSSNPTKIKAEKNESLLGYVDTLTVSATLKADGSVNASDECVVSQEEGNVLQYVSLELIDPAHDGVIGYAESASYKVWAHYSAEGDVDVTDNAVLYIRETSSGSTASPYLLNPSKGALIGNNQGDVIEAKVVLTAATANGTYNGFTSVDNIGVSASRKYFSEGNQPTIMAKAYLYAEFEGMSTATHDGGRKSLSIEGQPANMPKVTKLEFADDAVWTFVRKEGEYADSHFKNISGPTNTFYPMAMGTYTITATDGDGRTSDFEISVGRKTNNIIARPNADNTGFDVTADYPVASDISYLAVRYIYDGNERTSYGSLLKDTDSSTVLAPLRPDSTIISFNGSVENDPRFSYIYQSRLRDYDRIELAVDASSIAHDGSATYTVSLYDIDGNLYDVTKLASVKGFTTTGYTTESDYVLVNNGSIIGMNTGKLIPEYDSLYVKPATTSAYVGNTVTVGAYSRSYGSGRESTTSKTVHLKAEYMGMTATFTPFTVRADGGKLQTEGIETSVSANWSVSGGTLSATSGMTTVCTVKSSSVTVTAVKDGYIVVNEGDNVCSIVGSGATVVDLKVQTMSKQIGYGNECSLTGVITFNDGTVKNYTSSPVTYGGRTYIVEYENLDTSVSDSDYEIGVVSVTNRNKGHYDDEPPKVLVMPSSQGYNGDDFILSITGKSVFVPNDEKTIHIGGTVMIYNSGSSTSTGITDTTKSTDNSLVLSSQVGSNVPFTINDWVTADSDIAYRVSSTMGTFGSKEGTTTGTVTYNTANGTKTTGKVLTSYGLAPKTIKIELDRTINLNYNEFVPFGAGQGPNVMMRYCTFRGSSETNPSIPLLSYGNGEPNGDTYVVKLENEGAVSNYVNVEFIPSQGMSIDSIDFAMYDSDGFEFDKQNCEMVFSVGYSTLGKLSFDYDGREGTVLSLSNGEIPFASSIPNGATVTIKMNFTCKRI